MLEVMLVMPQPFGANGQQMEPENAKAICL